MCIYGYLTDCGRSIRRHPGRRRLCTGPEHNTYIYVSYICIATACSCGACDSELCWAPGDAHSPQLSVARYLVLYTTHNSTTQTHTHQTRDTSRVSIKRGGTQRTARCVKYDPWRMDDCELFARTRRAAPQSLGRLATTTAAAAASAKALQ